MKKSINIPLAIVHYVNLSAVAIATIWSMMDWINSEYNGGVLIFYMGLGVLQPILSLFIGLYFPQLNNVEKTYYRGYWLSILGLFISYALIGALNKIINFDYILLVIAFIPVLIAYYFVFVTYKIAHQIKTV